MKKIPSILFVGAASIALWASNVSAAEQVEPNRTQAPGEVALNQEGHEWIFRHFPSNLRLYVYDRDTPGKSNCVGSCSYAWPPLVAEKGSKPLGDWTLVKREGGYVQWAYKGRPVYVLFHDSPNQPQGNGADDNNWHFLVP